MNLILGCRWYSSVSPFEKYFLKSPQIFFPSPSEPTALSNATIALHRRSIHCSCQCHQIIVPSGSLSTMTTTLNSSSTSTLTTTCFSFHSRYEKLKNFGAKNERFHSNQTLNFVFNLDKLDLKFGPIDVRNSKYGWFPTIRTT